MTDRDSSYMKEMWGTTKLVTDYTPDKKQMLREVSTEKFMKEQVNEETELFNSWDYGIDSFTLNT